MAKSSLPTTPRGPRLFGFVSRGVLHWITVLVSFAVLVWMFAVLVGLLRGIGVPTADPTVTTTAPPAPDLGNSYTPLHDLRREQSQLLEVDQQSQRVWDDIDQFEKDALAWRESFEKLLVSDTGKKLKHDQWVVEYAWLHQDDSLRKFRAADDFREALNKRTDAIRQALDDPNGKLTVTEEDKRALAGIAERVTKTREVYNAHRRLVDALVGTTESGGQYEPKNLKEAVEQFDWKRILADFGHPDYVDHGSVHITVDPTNGPSQPISPTPKEIEELEAAVKRDMMQRRDGGEVGRSTRMVDELPDPDSGGMGERGPGG